MREDWIEVSFSEVLDIISGKNQKNVVSSNGKYPIYGSGGEIGRASSYLCREGTTIIGRKGTINNPIYVREKFWNVDTAFGLSPFSALNKRYLFFFARGFNFARLDKSTTIPSLSKRDLLQILIPLAPLPEQRAIVAKIEELLSELDKGEEDLKKAQEQLKIYRQAVLKKAFEGDWDKVKLGSVCEKVLKVKRKEMPLDTRLLYLDIGGIDNVKNKIINHKEYKWENAPSRAQQIIKVGDVLFSTVRTYLKNIARVENPIYENQVASSGFTVIRGKTGILDSKYIFYITTSEFFLEPLNELQRGTSYPAVRDKDVNSQLIPLPNFSEQENIVREIESRLSVCESIEESIRDSLNKSKALRQSILKKAFEGTLLSEEEIAACKAASDYEPASVLLEKIKAEKKKS